MKDHKFNNFFIEPCGWGTKNPITTAYHYTSPEAFLSILRDGYIRFSDIEYMNDRSEMVYVYKVFLDFLDEHKEEYPYVRKTLAQLIGEENFSDIQLLRATHISYKELPDDPWLTQRIFLLCMSTDDDSLNMWNYYIQNGNYKGYNIGFDLNKFLSTFDIPEEFKIENFEVRYGEVIYDLMEQRQYVEKIVKDFETVNGLLTDEVAVRSLGMTIALLGMFMKHSSFQLEHEFRIALIIKEHNIPHEGESKDKFLGENNKEIIEDFCVKNGMLVPFLKVKITKESIAGITIAPVMEYDLARRSISELLKIKQYPNVNIKQSEIPIRY